MTWYTQTQAGGAGVSRQIPGPESLPDAMLRRLTSRKQEGWTMNDATHNRDDDSERVPAP